MLRRIKISLAGTCVKIRVGSEVYRNFFIAAEDFGRLRYCDSFYIPYPDNEFLLMDSVTWIDPDHYKLQVESVKLINQLQLAVLEATYDK